MSKFNEKTKTNHPFTTPEGYFDRFADQLMEQLPDKEPVVVKKITLWERVSPWVYMAAMFIGVALFFKYALTPGNKFEASDPIRYDHSSVKKALADMSEDEFFEIMEEQAIQTSYYQTFITDSNY